MAPGPLKVELHLNDGNRAPLGKVHETMVVQLTAPKKGANDDKVLLDLVAVLDTSGSMKEGAKLESMKDAMIHVIREIGIKNRLAIVTFANKAEEKAKLLTRNSVKLGEVETTVNSLQANGGTMMSAGLELGLKILSDRREERIRNKAAAIFLMSDGHQNNHSNAAAVDIPPGVAIHTFGFGADHDDKLLKDIAKKSHGGMYHRINDTSNKGALKEAFSQPLAGHKRIVIKDLQLTMAHEPTVKVEAELGAYRPKIMPGSVTSTIGELFSEEHRRVLVILELPAAAKEGNQTVATLEWTYRHMPDEKTTMQDKLPIVINRTVAAANPQQRLQKLRSAEMFSAAAEPHMKKQVRTEVVRNAHLCMLKEVKKLAKNKDLAGAQDKVADAINELDNILQAPSVDLSKETIDFLCTEMEELRDLLDEPMYDKLSVSYARAAIMSHARQRFAARGDVRGVRLFATPRMDKFLTGMAKA